MTPPRNPRLLVVDDDHVFRLSTAALLRGDGYDVDVASDGKDAVDKLRNGQFDLMLLDVRMPGIDGLQLVEALRIWGHGVPILMISGFGTVETAVRSLHLGADDFLTKPVEPALLSARVSELLARRPSLTSDVEPPGGLVGRSPPMRALTERIRKVAATDTTVLVTGETGVGKELVARAVHDLSPRAGEIFLAVNCGALAEGILESELFGHVRGAFTGAARDRIGVFEAAEGGTLFLDEVGEMSLALQQRLLRALQEREVTRVGATRPTPVDVRVVAATNRELGALVADGRFREDLFYRLAVFPLAVPPLRERTEDIPLLVEHGLGRLRQRLPGWESLACSPFAMRVLRAHEWPGNVRQLFGALESAAVYADGGRIEAQHLPPEVRAALDVGHDHRYRAVRSMHDERIAILTALEHAEGIVSRAADLLGMGRTTLWRKMKAYGVSAGGDETASGEA